MTVSSTIIPAPASRLLGLVESQSGQQILRCYQCGKCSAGCPAAYVMDLTPRQIMRALQLGLEEEVLRSNAFWFCISCQTCSARCPREIDIARVMESLRLISTAQKREAAEKNVERFHNFFLSFVRRYGRVYELGLGALYSLSSGSPFANVGMAPGMLSRGKLAILPHRAKGTSEIQKIFARVKEEESALHQGAKEK